MSDIVTRLRCAVLGGEMDGRDIAEAADEIERLEVEVRKLFENNGWAAGEIARLTAALEQAVDDFGDHHSVCEETKQMCIAALNGEKE